jgi:hypothetical protein
VPRSWRRKYSALYDNVLESGLPDGKLAPLIRLQSVLHRAWRADPVRFAAWTEGDAEKTLTLGELYEVSGVASLHKARAKVLALSGCDPYQLGALAVTLCANPGWTSARPGRGTGARSDAQTVSVRWPKFAEVLNLRGPGWRASGGAAAPYEGRGTKNEARGRGPVPLGAVIGEVIDGSQRGTPPYGRRVGERQEGGRAPEPSPGWNPPPGTARLSEMTDEEREEVRRTAAAAKEKRRHRSHVL